MDVKSIGSKDWEIIAKGLNDSMNYENYGQLLEDYTEQKKTTGIDQDQILIDFTKLNFQRAKRLNKKAILTDEFKRKIESIKSDQTWLVITESWCGDAVQALPFFNLATVFNEHITLKIILRDEHTQLMDLFLTNGGRSIPKLIILDEQNQNVLGDWGPRPKDAQEMYMDFRNNPNGRVYQDIQIDLQRWYLKDKGVTMQNEIAQIL